MWRFSEILNCYQCGNLCYKNLRYFLNQNFKTFKVNQATEFGKCLCAPRTRFKFGGCDGSKD